MHSVFATSLVTAALSVVENVCSPDNSVPVALTQWGVEHEEDAGKAYTVNNVASS